MKMYNRREKNSKLQFSECDRLCVTKGFPLINTQKREHKIIITTAFHLTTHHSTNFPTTRFIIKLNLT